MVILGAKYQQGITRLSSNYVNFRFNSPPRLRAETRLKITDHNLKPAGKDRTILRLLFFFQRKSNQDHSHKLSFMTATAFQDFRKLRLLKWIMILHYPMISAEFQLLYNFFLSCLHGSTAGFNCRLFTCLLPGWGRSARNICYILGLKER